MVRRRSVTLLLIIGGFALVPGVATAQSLERWFDGDRSHDIRQGEALGVRIGMDRATARAALERTGKIRFASTRVCRGRDDWYCEGAQAIDTYTASEFLKLDGVVEAFIVNNRVVRLSWWAHTLDP